MIVLPPCDVVVVGLGAAGGLSATLLADAGLSVVGLEAGPRHGPGEFAPDEISHESRNVLGDAKANHEIPTVRSSPAEQAVPATGTRGLLMMNGVDGSKVHSTNVSWRLSPWNFVSLSAVRRRYGAGAVPPGSTLVDWPLDYTELAPYYDEVEARYGISGQAGNIAGRPQPGGNPYEGPRSGPYPLPPLRQTGYSRMMGEAAHGLGWSPFPTPASIRSQPYAGRGACVYCGSCTWNGCRYGAKALPTLHGLDDAERGGALTVRTGARVTRVLTDEDEAVRGVEFIENATAYRQPARAVVLATYTYENVRLLLLSASPAFPRGLANNAGNVGRHFMTHSFPMTLGVFPGRDLKRWGGTAAQSAAVTEFDADHIDHSGLGFIGGSVLMTPAENKAIFNALWTPPSVPRWGSAWKRWLHENAHSIGWVWTLPDVLPYEQNVLDLDPVARDRDGVPRIRSTYRYFDNEVRQTRFLLDRAAEWLTAAGAAETWHLPTGPTPVSTHAYGGTRMGDDPGTSVVDRWGEAHEVPGLVVLGASTFPTSGGVNPTETVEALAVRSTRHLIGRLNRTRPERCPAPPGEASPAS
ncbi:MULTISPECIES: GMC family oxidoreductase [unclassified Streptomyces]|uniref:GMC family oxidoreductase n=1 Tax=unclassified Streptomyces TaxID=2593676 RepID=UPI002E2916B3|nr:GMC family oxidoreductase [Streptomyces sp. NBC_00223]